MWKRRALELIGQLFVGDGLTSLLVPKAHMRLWQDVFPSRSWRHMVEWFADRPGVTRILGLFSLVTGVWLILKSSEGQQSKRC
jgi:hypothetical protein